MTAPMIGPDHAETLAAVHRIVRPWWLAARAHGPLPYVRSDAFATADPHVQIAVLLILGAAWVVEDPRRAHLAMLREVSRDVHAGDTTFWRNLAANHIPYAELQRRRAVPGPMAQNGAP